MVPATTRSSTLLLLLTLLLAPWLSAQAPATALLDIDDPAPASGRAVHTWSGAHWMNTSTVIPAGDELVVQAGANVQFGPGARLYIEGRLTIEGTTAQPVTIDVASGFNWHDGIQFNTTSNNRGSTIRNLSMLSAQYGFTIYNSNPTIDNLTLINPDAVGLDIFGTSTPAITSLTIIGGGQDVHGSWGDWRYGIGLSAGGGATPIVNGADISGVVSRGVSLWGSAGGLLRDISVSNVTGATLNYSAGIWIEDSVALIEDATVTGADNGVMVVDFDDPQTTRPTLRDIEVVDSQYLGVFVQKWNHSNLTHDVIAFLEDITITGTGGPTSAGPGNGVAAFAVNSTGVDLDGLDVVDNPTLGVELYATSQSTRLQNVTLDNNGGTGPNVERRANLLVRSSDDPRLEHLHSSNATGSGVLVQYSSPQGLDWLVEDNEEHGVLVNRGDAIISGLTALDNNLSGVRVWDSRGTVLEDVMTRRNGAGGSSGADGAGVALEKSNDVVTSGHDIVCRRCDTADDVHGGIWISRSLDVVLSDLRIGQPANGSHGLWIDNTNASGVMLDRGNVTILGAEVALDRAGPAVELLAAGAWIEGLHISGANDGLRWDGFGIAADQTGLWASSFNGTDCLDLRNLAGLRGGDLTISAGCAGNLSLVSSAVNLSTVTDVGGSEVWTLDGTSVLHLHQPTGVDASAADLAPGAILDLAWDLDVSVVNGRGNGIPGAAVTLTFDQLEGPKGYLTDGHGLLNATDLIGQRWTSAGSTGYSSVDVECDYASTTNTTTILLDGDNQTICRLDLPNQPPFVTWLTPEEGAALPHATATTLNATGTWDLDDDPLTFTWSSSRDGSLGTGEVRMATLTDGEHQLTLEVSDGGGGHLVTLTRNVTVTNLPPTLVIETDPEVDLDGVLRVNRTDLLRLDASGSSDPEGTALTFAWVTTQPGGGEASLGTDAVLENVSFLTHPLDTFQLILRLTDGFNPELEWPITVELRNLLPEPVIEVTRGLTNTSDVAVVLNGSGTTDPEGDTIGFAWVSNLDGVIADGSAAASGVWTGHLSHGTHTITLRATDDHPQHATAWAEATVQVLVENSAPVVNLASPAAGAADTSTLLGFSAEGSGDWDVDCEHSEGRFFCNQYNSTPDAREDVPAVRWDSSIDGLLSTDWVWEGRLSAGDHVLTLTLDDNANPPVTESVNLTIGQSAPQLVITSPEEGAGIASSEEVLLDVRDSRDWDLDAFSLSVSSSSDGVLLTGADPLALHILDLSTGDHTLTLNLTDATGRTRLGTVNLTILASAPTAVISSPATEGAFIAPGGTVHLDGANSTDPDGDIVLWQWELVGESIVSLGDVQSAVVTLPPGAATLRLTVTDSRGATDQAWRNLTIGSSNPRLANLTVGSETATQGVEQDLFVSVVLDDPDGTTQVVVATLTLGTFRLDEDLNDAGVAGDETAGDGIWSGRLTWTPDQTGVATLRVVAIDGVGAQTRVSPPVATEVIVEEAAAGGLEGLGAAIASPITLGVIGLLIAGVLVFLLVQRRRRVADDLSTIETWASLKRSAEPGDSGGNALDQTAAVDAVITRQDDADDDEAPPIDRFADLDL